MRPRNGGRIERLAPPFLLSCLLLRGGLLGLADALLRGLRRLLGGGLLAAAAPLGCLGGFLPLLSADGAFGAGDVTVAIDEIDVVGVHLEPAVGDLFRPTLGDARLLPLDLPNRSVLHVIHELLFTSYAQLCDFLG